ncbi:MAG TPA: DUF3299 domain-containing protein [Opitutaceae bacterium]|nr:DUF3299 domain-containing protein [Opitutaceae bacterium]
MIAGLLLAARLDPSRAERKRREEAELLAVKIRKETALAARPCPVPVNGVTEITFKALEFVPLTSPQNLQTGVTAFAVQAPPRIRLLDAKHVRISGFALPIRYESGRVQDFLILANQLTCCFGYPPRFCDYILAHAESGAGSPRTDLPTSFEGTLHVRDIYANGAWSALYSMDCTKLTPDFRH